MGHFDQLGAMEMEIINIAEAKSRFSELISRTAAGERFLIRRRERPMAVLISSADLERLERTSRAAQRLAMALGQDAELLRQVEAGEVHPAMAAFGLWHEEADLETLADEIYANRQRQTSRGEVTL
jgi:prevent-host-death family protein